MFTIKIITNNNNTLLTKFKKAINKLNVIIFINKKIWI